MITKDEILSAAAEKAQEFKLELELILAFIQVESGFYPYSHRFEPKWRYCLPDADIARLALHNRISEATERIDQMSSFGVMQVMGTFAREKHYTGNLADLYDPKYGIHFGCIKLKELFEKYPNSLDDVICAYNHGHAEQVGGLYVNQKYVDDVKKALNQTKG